MVESSLKLNLDTDSSTYPEHLVLKEVNMHEHKHSKFI